MLEHVFAPFLECCGDAVMFAKRHAALDDEDDVTAMAIVFLLMKLRGCIVFFLFLMTLKRNASFCLHVVHVTQR